jgi:hypothetical protein
VSSRRPCSGCSRAGCLSTTVPTPAATLRRSTVRAEAPSGCFPTVLRRTTDAPITRGCWKPV